MPILPPSHRKLTSCYLNKKKQWLPTTKGIWCYKPRAKSGSPFLMVTSSTFIAVISNVLLDCCYEGLASFRNSNQKIILLIYIAFQLDVNCMYLFNILIIYEIFRQECF